MVRSVQIEDVHTGSLQALQGRVGLLKDIFSTQGSIERVGFGG